MKDSVIIKDGIIYFGRLNLSENVLDSQLNLNTLKKINGSSIKTIQLNSRNRRIIITDNADVQETISLDKAIDMTAFINEILDSFQHARILDDDNSIIYLIKKPLIGIAVLFFLVLIISFLDPNSNSYNGSRLSTQVIDGLLYGFASLGMPKVILIFGAIMLIPIFRIILKLRNRKGITIINFNTFNTK